MSPAAERLGWSRAALGALFLLRTTPLLAPLHVGFLAGTVPLLGWPDHAFAGAALLPLPPVVVATLCILRTLAAAAFMLGVRTRAAGIVAGTAAYLVLAQTPFDFLLTYHLLFLGTLLVAVAGGGVAFALRPEAPRDEQSGERLVQLFVVSIYAWAAFAKLRPDWLDGRTLELFHADGALRGGLADLLLAGPARRTAVAVGVVATEALLGPLLLWARSRRYALVVAVAFHAALQIVATPDFFSWEMLALLLCFWPVARQKGAPAPAW